jgi:hypothetical protein
MFALSRGSSPLGSRQPIIGEWELGLISDNPLRYSLSFVQMIIGWSAFMFGASQLKRFR